MKTSDVPESTCPVCGTVAVEATHLSKDVVPEPGDFTVCCGCSAILRFGPDMQRRLATVEEIKAQPMETQIDMRNVQLGIRKVKAAQN
jgi:hypothetical protein